MDNKVASNSPGSNPERAITPELLEAYFKSIEKPFLHTRLEMSQENDGLKAVVVIAFIFSLIPLIPYGISFAVPRLFSVKPLSLWNITFSSASFWFWWIASFLVSLLLMIA